MTRYQVFINGNENKQKVFFNMFCPLWKNNGNENDLKIDFELVQDKTESDENIVLNQSKDYFDSLFQTPNIVAFFESIFGITPSPLSNTVLHDFNFSSENVFKVNSFFYLI